MKNDLWTDSQTGAPPGDQPDAGLTPAALLGACVMLVDDDPLMTEVVQGHLEDAGYRNFVVTNDPRETIALMRKHEPSIVLLDLMMPQMSGYDVLVQVRAEAAFRFTPVIVLTAATGSDAKLRALQLGATDILAKPVDESELLLRVRNTLAFRRYHEQAVNVDDVTGLPSRRRFEQRVMEATAADAAQPRADVAIFIINLPSLTQVRETMGQPAADKLAKVLAGRLEDALRAQPGGHGTGMAARLRGDEFALMLIGMAGADAVGDFARKLGRRLSEAVTVNAQSIVPQAHIGIAMSASEGATREALLKGAEQARSRARETGAHHVFFSSELDRRSNERLTLATALREAVSGGQLVVLYQPKVDMASGEVSGVEVIPHWDRPGFGLLAAPSFMALAEELDLGVTIGQWALRQACTDALRWLREGRNFGQLCFNVPAGLWQGGRLPELLRRAIQATRLPASRLAIEITEELLHGNQAASMQGLREIAAVGVGIVVDDFGSGHTSLSMIKQLPACELKAAAAIVAALPGQPADSAIARTIATLGHSLGLAVAADGVSTPEQLLELTQLEFDRFQGPLFSEPVSADELATLLPQAR